MPTDMYYYIFDLSPLFLGCLTVGNTQWLAILYYMTQLEMCFMLYSVVYEIIKNLVKLKAPKM